MMMPNWPSLWEREPGLRPRKDYSWRAGRVVYPLVYVENGCGLDGRGEYCWQGDGHGWVDPEDAAAFARDAAAIFLTRAGFHLSFHETLGWSIKESADDPDLMPGTDRYATPDEALFAGCKARIDARDAARKDK